LVVEGQRRPAGGEVVGHLGDQPPVRELSRPVGRSAGLWSQNLPDFGNKLDRSASPGSAVAFLPAATRSSDVPRRITTAPLVSADVS
jgi:hypothetical protein